MLVRVGSGLEVEVWSSARGVGLSPTVGEFGGGVEVGEMGGKSAGVLTVGWRGSGGGLPGLDGQLDEGGEVIGREGSGEGGDLQTRTAHPQHDEDQGGENETVIFS